MLPKEVPLLSAVQYRFNDLRYCGVRDALAPILRHGGVVAPDNFQKLSSPAVLQVIPATDALLHFRSTRKLYGENAQPEPLAIPPTPTAQT